MVSLAFKCRKAAEDKFLRFVWGFLSIFLGFVCCSSSNSAPCLRTERSRWGSSPAAAAAAAAAFAAAAVAAVAAAAGVGEA